MVIISPMSDFSHQTNPNPNPTNGESQHVTQGSFPFIYGGFQVHPSFHQHPNAPDIKSLSETPLVSTILNSLWSNSWTNQHSLNNVTMKTTKPKKAIQSFRCEVCKVDCNSKDILETHMQGKKHKKNANLGQIISGASDASAGGESEMKPKPLESGPSVDSAIFCKICNVACNSQVVFDNHLSGKKHAAKATAPSKTVQSTWCDVCKVSCNSKSVLAIHNLGKKHLKNLEKLKSATGAPASNAVAPAATQIIGPMENPEASKSKVVGLRKSKRKAAKSQASVEDLETKRRKAVESGAAADSVRACNICNVVCNSPTVFSSHLAGQRHAAMLKKKHVQVEIKTDAITVIAPP